MGLRKAAFAGSWYPRRASDCENEIRGFLADGGKACNSGGPWLAGIVPHAGWYYSGRIACRTIACLKDVEPIDLVVVFGMHLHRESANYMMPEGQWETPLGVMPVAGDLAGALMQQFDFHLESPDRFVQDNTVELQLPFIKHLLDPVEFLALGVPPTSTSLQIGRAVVDWAREKKKRLKVIGSTDLTHYGPNYGFTPQGDGPQAVNWVRNHNDRQVIDAMLAMDPEKVVAQGLENQNACCAGAAAAAIAAARHAGATRSLPIAYATSYDIIPDNSFVGYAGIVYGSDPH
jgi:MEMO1 family protein